MLAAVTVNCTCVFLTLISHHQFGEKQKELSRSFAISRTNKLNILRHRNTNKSKLMKKSIWLRVLVWGTIYLVNETVCRNYLYCMCVCVCE